MAHGNCSHIIPRFYLEQFASANRRKGKPGNVWVYEKGKPPRPSSTKAQGYENGYLRSFTLTERVMSRLRLN